MKKIKNTVFLLWLILISCVFVACGANTENQTEPDSYSNGEQSIRYISVITAEQNDNRVFEVRWPNTVRSGSFINSNKLENATQELSKEEIEYFINYVESIETMDSLDNKHVNYISKDDYKDHEYLGSVKISYDDGNGNYKQSTRFIFDEYPAGYSEFIEKFGTICGEDYIPLDYNIQDLNVAYFRRMASIGAYVPDEVIEEYLDITECDMFLLLESDICFAAKYDIEKIETLRHMPKSLLNEASTEDELKEYVLEIAHKFGVHESEVYSDKIGGYYFRTKYGSIDVYPSNGYPYPEYISEFEWENSNVKFYNIQDFNGPEGMIYAYTFVYSDDGKFMVILPDCVSKNTNEIIKIIFDE